MSRYSIQYIELHSSRREVFLGVGSCVDESSSGVMLCYFRAKNLLQRVDIVTVANSRCMVSLVTQREATVGAHYKFDFRFFRFILS